MWALTEWPSNPLALGSHSKQKKKPSESYFLLHWQKHCTFCLIWQLLYRMKIPHLLIPTAPASLRSGLVCSEYSCTLFASPCRQRCSRYNSRLQNLPLFFQTLFQAFLFLKIHQEHLLPLYLKRSRNATLNVLSLWLLKHVLSLWPPKLNFHLPFPKLTCKVLWG